MVAMQAVRHEVQTETGLDFDAIVIGAGVAGLYQLYKLRELGLRVRVFEAGGGSAVPGIGTAIRAPASIPKARPTAIRSPRNCWTSGIGDEHFAPQPETERYLNYVADKFDLRRDIQFNSRVAAAHYHDETRSWEITLEDGSRYSARFLVTAIGILSAPTMPNIPGIDTFKGESCHTHAWPRKGVDFAGKRVGIIGTGATAVQTIQEIAKTVGHLTVFQRTPNWCAPLHNGRISAAEMRDIRAQYDEIFALCQHTPGCYIHAPGPAQDLDVPPEEREAFWEKLYASPGFGIWMGNFSDMLTDRAANAAALRLHRAQDPAARQRPESRRKADPEEPRIRHPPRPARNRLLRSLQPAQRPAGRHQRDADRAHHADRHQDQRARVRIRHHHLCDRF